MVSGEHLAVEDGVVRRGAEPRHRSADFLRLLQCQVTLLGTTGSGCASAWCTGAGGDVVLHWGRRTSQSSALGWELRLRQRGALRQEGRHGAGRFATAWCTGTGGATITWCIKVKDDTPTHCTAGGQGRHDNAPRNSPESRAKFPTRYARTE